MAVSGDWDLAAASASISSAGRGSSVGRGSFDPDSSAAPGSSVGHGSSADRGSWDPNPLAEELLSSCRACGSGRSTTSTMLTASEVAAM
jgi:hypothetical protein